MPRTKTKVNFVYPNRMEISATERFVVDKISGDYVTIRQISTDLCYDVKIGNTIDLTANGCLFIEDSKED